MRRTVLGLLIPTVGFFVQAADPVMVDAFDSLEGKPGRQTTSPVLVGAGGAEVTGRLSGTNAALEPHATGKALRLREGSWLRYAAVPVLNPAGGALSLQVKLNFDPTMADKRTRTVLRNQFFAEIRTPEGHRALLYTCLKNVCVLVQNAKRTMLLSKAADFPWRRGEWHELTLRWGNRLEVLADGRRCIEADWSGLFGPLPVHRVPMRLAIGAGPGSGIVNEFSVDQLRLYGPARGRVGARPLLSVPRVPGTPVLDGRLDDGFWGRAGAVSGFVRFNRRELADPQPRFFLAQADGALWVGADIPLPDGRAPRASLTRRDASVCTEDAVELLLQPDPASDAWFQLIANAIGTRMDLRRAGTGRPDLDFDPEWEVRTSRKRGGWSFEARIPFRALGLAAPPQSGASWRGNLIVDSANGWGNARTWALTDGDFVNPYTFGEFRFTGGPRAIRQTVFRGTREGRPEIVCQLTGPYNPAVTVRTRIFDAFGEPVFRDSVQLTDGPAAAFRAGPLGGGAYTARTKAEQEGGPVLFRQDVIFTVEKGFNMTLANYPYAGVTEVRIDARALPKRAAILKLAVTGGKGPAAPPRTVAPGPDGLTTVKLPSAGLAPGRYMVTVTAEDRAGKEIDKTARPLRIFPKPKWWRNRVGIDHSVPPPFEPVRRAGNALAVWGRRFEFGGGAFPRAIRSRGVELFTAPPRLVLRTRVGQTDLAALDGARETAVHPDAVTRTWQGAAAGLGVTCRSTLDFDGCLRCDLRIEPGTARAVEGLRLELPLPAAVAKFALISNGRSGTVVPVAPPARLRFAPYMWVGNDDLGLAVFTESDQHWTNTGAGAIELARKGDTVVLRWNIVTARTPLSGPMALSIGLMPSPVRPVIEGDPFQPILYSGPDKVVFPERLEYPTPNRLATAGAGTLECLVRRPADAGRGLAELLYLAPGKGAVLSARWTPRGEFLLMLGRKVLVKAPGTLPVDRFVHVALCWDNEAVVLYSDGRRILKQPVTDALRAVLTDADPQARLGIGCASDYRGWTALVVDEMRVSAVRRYRGERIAVPLFSAESRSNKPGDKGARKKEKAERGAQRALFSRDADTLVLDHLDQAFRPDGEDGRTRAGGVPSLGCVFTAGAVGRGLRIQVGSAKSAAELVREAGSSIGFEWTWVEDVRKTGWPPDLFDPGRAGLAAHVKHLQGYGLKVLPYAVYPAIGAPSDLADQFGEEWACKPVSTLPSPPPPGHVMLNCSLAAPGYADYLAAGTRRMMTEFGMDGIYTDGACNVRSSQNAYAGAGYTDRRGKRRPTVPIWGTRETLKRLYRIVKRIKPDGVVMNHVSFNLLLPVLSFSDYHYTGEHENYEDLSQTRLRFSSRPWGLQITLLGSSRHVYSSTHTMIALLHGTSIFGHGIMGRRDLGRKWINLRRVYRRARTRTAQWFPYFHTGNPVTVRNNPDAHVSSYVHPGEDAFLVVGNLSRKDLEVDLALDLARMGLEGRELTARNALTEVVLGPPDHGRLRVPVRAGSFTLVALGP